MRRANGKRLKQRPIHKGTKSCMTCGKFSNTNEYQIYEFNSSTPNIENYVTASE